MLAGNSASWGKRLITLEERFLNRVAVSWPECMALLEPQPEEDQITMNLVSLLMKDQIVRQICHYVEYQFEPFGYTIDGTAFSKGKIDMAVKLDQEREWYLAYECKRLNVVYGTGRQSLATPYVKEGMARYITEQYAEHMPVGGMLGYVLDADIVFASKRVTAAITKHGAMNLLSGPSALSAVNGVRRFTTTHSRPHGGNIELRHAFVA